MRNLVLVLDTTKLSMVSVDSIRKLKCKECGSRFKYPERLEKHKEIAHNKKKEKCRACGTEFHSSENLRKHKKICTERV
ncbi:MAG: C2H2-type zinc finger protein [Nitrosopumilus sp.]|nr:C2H2-type zinc finger protein [Nitrosopumilus sp.]